MGILSNAGDHLPVWKTRTDKKSGRTTVSMEKNYHKDGESPGEEWTRTETAVIRALANPKTCTPEKASKVTGVTTKTIRRWLRSPYFMDEIWKLTNSHLQQARTRVINSVIENAVGGSYQDRNLFFRLTGDLKEKGSALPGRKSEPGGDDGPPDDWLQSDIDALSEDYRRTIKRRK